MRVNWKMPTLACKGKHSIVTMKTSRQFPIGHMSERKLGKDEYLLRINVSISWFVHNFLCRNSEGL